MHVLKLMLFRWLNPAWFYLLRSPKLYPLWLLPIFVILPLTDGPRPSDPLSFDFPTRRYPLRWKILLDLLIGRSMTIFRSPSPDGPKMAGREGESNLSRLLHSAVASRFLAQCWYYPKRWLLRSSGLHQYHSFQLTPTRHQDQAYRCRHFEDDKGYSRTSRRPRQWKGAKR